MSIVSEQLHSRNGCTPEAGPAEDWHESGAELMAMDDAVRNEMARLKAQLPPDWDVTVDPGGWATYRRDGSRGDWRVTLLPPRAWERVGVEHIVTAEAPSLADAACAALAKYRAANEPLLDLLRNYGEGEPAKRLDELADAIGGVA